MNIGITEIIIVALIILLLFGGKKIPELMRGLGKGVRSFKDGVNGKEEGEEQTKDSSADTNDKVSEQK
ncbi:MAG: twin-arginine translocase TatA/TatE family subunit [Paludibacteraceae bacterium]|jgi:sec-independent protein translocase protein TatA|nr:twin-arginine translocase TatA/TatE family subunit [Paludibacteraceae bacterium]MBR1787075.1 twin-arginine translocase TatA/TatE family subunit [Paludibacteraceae bacterium]